MRIDPRWRGALVLASPGKPAGEDLVKAAITATQLLRRSQRKAISAELREMVRIRLDLANLTRFLEDREEQARCRLFVQALRVHVAGLQALTSALECCEAAGTFHHYLDVPRLRVSCERQAGAALHYALTWCRQLGVNPTEEAE